MASRLQLRIFPLQPAGGNGVPNSPFANDNGNTFYRWLLQYATSHLPRQPVRACAVYGGQKRACLPVRMLRSLRDGLIDFRAVFAVANASQRSPES